MGFTPLTESIGEEEMYSLMQGCVGRMMDAVHRYEGTVTQFRGDGVMALFGAPIAHEDAARRAVAAALEMQRSLEEYASGVKKRYPIECRFRVGLNTGPVVVGTISDNLDMDYTAIGDTVNLAARMEQLAEPGTVYLTENTHRAVRDYVECEPLGSLSVKGKSEPVVAYRVLREKPVRTRLEVAAERGLTPFVGREQELSVLQGYFDQAKGGRGQVVFVSGEAGIGKSRLLFEFRRSLLDEGMTWLEGHCISFGKRIPYLPISDLIKRNFGVEEGDNDVRIIRRVDEGTAGWEDAARATAPYLKYLLNVDPGDPAIAVMDPLVRRAGILDGLRALLLQESRSRLLTVVVEDLHWIDEKSEDALRALVDVVATTPVLLVLTYRPGHSLSLGERTYYSRLALGHLRPEESAVIAEGVLQVSGLPDQLRQLITAKAEGNPFFVEEVTKSLMESGVLRKSNGSLTVERPIDEIRVPDTIQEVILSRIDRLDREARDAIQLASVIGREFTVRLLERISDIEAKVDDLLSELKSLELIYEKAYFPELAYMFKHALTHDVAYSTLLLERRKSLHRLVAAAIEELYADRLPEHYEALAHHYYEGQEWEKALDYLDKAGDKAAAAYANQDALDYYGRALEVCERLGKSTLRAVASIAQKRALVNFTIADPGAGIADLERMLAAARSLGDRPLEGISLAYRGLFQCEEHDFERSADTFREALAIGEETRDNEVVFAAQVGLLAVASVLNRHDEVEGATTAAREAIEKASDPMFLGVWALFHPIWANWTGHFTDAVARVRRFRQSVSVPQFVVMAVFNQWAEALALGGRGDYGEALNSLHDIISTCERIGEGQVRARAINTVGWIYGELQSHSEAMEWNTRGIEWSRQIKRVDPEFEFNAIINLGDNLLALGRLDEAEEQFKQVERVARNPQPEERWMLWRYSQHMFHSYGELWLARGDAQKALSYADECLNLAEQSESRKNIVKGRHLRGQALLAQRKPAEAETEIDIALGIAKEIGNPPQLWKTLVALGDLRKAQGRPQEALAAYREALTVIDSVAAGLTDESLRDSFLSSPHVEGIRAKASA